MPQYSIAIPVYNVAPYLGECLESVRRQALSDWECLCVDDGSVDSSGAILDAYARSDTRIRVCHQRNAGVSAARNRALGAAIGTWLLFLDSDDAWHPRLLELVEQTSCHSDAVCFGLWRGTEMQTFVESPLSVSGVRRVDWSRDLPAWAFGVGFYQCAYRREFLGPTCRFDIRFAYGEDRLWFLHALKSCNDVTVIDASLYGYRSREESAMAKSAKATFRAVNSGFGYAMATLQAFVDYPKEVPSIVIREFCSTALERTAMAIGALSRQDRKKMWNVYFDGIRHLRVPTGVSGWFRFVFAVLRWMPFSPLALLLCAAPCRLKMLGFHR